MNTTTHSRRLGPAGPAHRTNNIQARAQQSRPRNGGCGQQRANNAEAELSSAQEYRLVSLKTLAAMLDTTRSSARRWLHEAGVKPVSLGRGIRGAIRYRWQDVKAWLEAKQQVD